MFNFNLTLRAKIFLSMLLLLILSFLLTGTISLYHFMEENKEYHEERLLRKESIIHASIDYYFEQFPNLTIDSLADKVQPKILEWADVNNLDIIFYDMNGEFLISSNPDLINREYIEKKLNPMFALEVIKGNGEITTADLDTTTVMIYYKRVSDQFGKSLAIVALPYYESEVIPEQDIAFLESLITLNVILFLVAALVAYLLSNYITSSLTTIGQRLTRTQINRNKPLEWKSNDEIGQLVDEYNRMLNELEDNAIRLAKSERESAWKEMAKQVAHEIKNPLTPMRLMVQHLEMSLKTEDQEQLKEFTRAMIDQIDTMTSIADAFSRFAEMPALKREEVNLNELVLNAARLYPHLEVKVQIPDEKVLIHADRDQLLRVLNNLIKNGWQSIPEDRDPELKLVLINKGNKATISVTDNGSGIPQDKVDQIFEPSFTTKTHGMGLGLAMTKNIIEGLNGNIQFSTKENKGSTFTIELPNK